MPSSTTATSELKKQIKAKKEVGIPKPVHIGPSDDKDSVEGTQSAPTNEYGIQAKMKVEKDPNVREPLEYIATMKQL
eukprot:9898438-Prorocentrum_lima.AAC.1